MYLKGNLEHLERCWVCDSEKIFFTSKFSYVLFCNSTNKTETGTANTWGTTNSKTAWTNHYDGPIRNTEQQLDHIYYTLLCMCTPLQQRLVPATVTCPNYVEPKLFSWVKPVQFGIFFAHSYCAWSHTEHRWRCSYILKYLSFKEDWYYAYTLRVRRILHL